MGFSAGGHLAASLGTLWNNGELAELLGLEAEDIRPNGLSLSYPVITSGKEGQDVYKRQQISSPMRRLRQG